MPDTLRVGLFDFDADVRFGRRLILESSPHLEVVFESEGLTKDLTQISEGLFDVLVIDQRLASGSGLDFYRELATITGIKQAPSAILTTNFEEPVLKFSAIEQAIAEVVSLEQSAELLLAATLRAARGESATSLAEVRKLLLELSPRPELNIDLLRMVSDLPERFASNLRRLRQAFNNYDDQKLAQFDQSSLSHLVERLPVRNLAQLVIQLYRSELLDA